MPGGSNDLLVRARPVLLDALDALSEHRDSVIVIGAQAVYLHTGEARVAVAEATKDSDLAIDPRELADDPLIEAAMSAARFHRDPTSDQPGSWLSPSGIPVDLMVPEALAGGSGRRGVRIPPHAATSMRRALGLEAAVVDNAVMEISALAPDDDRKLNARVAGPAALLIAKMFKIGERVDNPKRLVDKDAYDAYRLLVAIDTEDLARSVGLLLSNEVSADVTRRGLDYLDSLFAAGPEAIGSVMAGRAEGELGSPETVAAACAALASDLRSAWK